MNKKLSVSWEGVNDSTGYLFSLAKSLSAAVLHSPYRDYAGDIVATSGFAFRMWVTPDLCPSATSIWGFDGQRPWVESGGLTCEYVGRYWGQEHIEEERRLEALTNIKNSIDRGVPAVSWDVGVPEWGLITGYDDEEEVLFTLPISADKADPTSPEYDPELMPYSALGKRDIPILSVLTITGRGDKSEADILMDTMRLAVNHLNGGEWCDNAKGLEAYPALIKVFAESPEISASWNAEYFLGTYGALKEYAYKYFERAGQRELAEIYRSVFDDWMAAFHIKTGEDANLIEIRQKIIDRLSSAREGEIRAVEIMSSLIG